MLTDDHRTAMHLKIMRDADGTPDRLPPRARHASTEEARQLEKAIWSALERARRRAPESLGRIGEDRSEPLAMTQLILLYHLLAAQAAER